MSDVTLSFRTSTEMANRVTQKATELGVGTTDVILDALTSYLGLPRLAKPQFMAGVAAIVATHFDPRTFPEDVILQVFAMARKNRKLWALYESLIRRPDGSVDDDMKGAIHRSVGKLVRVKLAARVKGRSPLLDPALHIISSHALLTPT